MAQSRGTGATTPQPDTIKAAINGSGDVIQWWRLAMASSPDCK